MLCQMEDLSRVFIRFKPEEEKKLRVVVELVRERSGYEIPITDILKALMQMRSLMVLTDEDRDLVKPEADAKPHGKFKPKQKKV